MFGNIGWGELFIIASLAILVIGPKELPQFLRVCGRYFGKIKGVADDFRNQFDDVVRDTQITEIKDNILKEVEEVKASLPTEKDIGLEFSELDKLDKSKDEILDEDENLDWDEPDEVIETNADGEVTSHTKKEASDTETQEASQDVAASDEGVGEAQANTKTAETKASSVNLDDDDDDGDLLDEEEYLVEDGQTSKDVLSQGREKFKEAVEADERIAALTKELEQAKHEQAETAKKLAKNGSALSKAESETHGV